MKTLFLTIKDRFTSIKLSKINPHKVLLYEGKVGS
jgi:hypothetical protein